jgi:hypothetical protein
MTDKIPNEKKPDLSELFDINRHKAVAGFVGRFEELMREREANADDFRELKAEAKDKMFSPMEIAAMSDIAKWRTGGKTNTAAEKLAALRRVSNAIKLDLFAWADSHREGDAT